MDADLCCLVQLHGSQGPRRFDPIRWMELLLDDVQQTPGQPRKDDTGLCLRQTGRAATRLHRQDIDERRCRLNALDAEQGATAK